MEKELIVLSVLSVFFIKDLFKKNKKDINEKFEDDIIFKKKGFVAKALAESGKYVINDRLKYHKNPDGGDVFKMKDGGWVYVSNSESSNKKGGVGALRFNKKGKLIKYYSILDKTERNCSGGRTPHNTWLSCEEHSKGIVWQCYPDGKRNAMPLPQLGVFSHEAAAVDPKTNIVYMTEDDTDGLIYKFVPKYKTDENYSNGILYAACRGKDKTVEWKEIKDPSAEKKKTRYQVHKGYRNNKWEGCVYHPDGYIYICESNKGIYRYDIKKNKLELFYKSLNSHDPSKLNSPDNICVTPKGNILVSEDPGGLWNDYLELWIIDHKTRDAYPFLQVHNHFGSELAGVAFSPNGKKLYFSSQRGKNGNGITYEISGNFNF